MKIEDAKKLIEEQNKKDMEVCQKEIEAVLKKHNCQFQVFPNVVINGQSVGIVISKKAE